MHRTYLLLAGLFAVVVVIVLSVPTDRGTNVPSETAPAASTGAAGEPVPAH